MKFFFSIVGICIAIIFGSFLIGTFGETTAVVQEQFGPRALLQKYEWFKDASARLDKLRADILVYEMRKTSLIAEYGDTPRLQWSREDRNEYNLIAAEVAGVKAAHNSLAAEYNAQMSKFNYRFTNVGDLPAGALEPLPREYRAYEVQ